MTLSAPGQSTLFADRLRTLMNREISALHDSTGFSITLLDAIRILAFSILICAALLMNFEGSAAWQILCAVEAVHLIVPALKSLIKQCND